MKVTKRENNSDVMRMYFLVSVQFLTYVRIQSAFCLFLSPNVTQLIYCYHVCLLMLTLLRGSNALLFHIQLSGNFIGKEFSTLSESPSSTTSCTCIHTMVSI